VATSNTNLLYPIMTYKLENRVIVARKKEMMIGEFLGIFLVREKIEVIYIYGRLIKPKAVDS